MKIMTEQYKCPSYFDDNNVLQDCACGKCMPPDKRVELKQKLEELSAINYNLYLAGTVKRADTGEDWTYDQALDEIVDFLTQYHQGLISEVEEKEYKRCVDLLDHDHAQCPIKETCIGYQNAQSDLMNNPPTEDQTIIKSLSK